MALKVGELFASFGIDSKGLDKQLAGIKKQFSSVAGGVGKAFAGTTAIISAAMIPAAKSVLEVGSAFEASMSKVAAISGATGAELEMLTETAKRYGETTMFSASQAADALNYMALAGWDAQQSVDALGGVLDLAAASGMDLGAASDAVTDYLSAFSMEASQAGYMADLMAYAQSKSNTSAAQLAEAYKNSASTMNSAGQDIETTTAMLMALANQGIKGSEAGTQMAAVMRDLTQKMSNGKIKIGDTAVAVQDAAGNFRDLNDIMADVDAATAGLGTAEKSAALMETFTARSVKAVNTILNEGVQSVNEYENALRGSEGTAAEQAKIMMDNLQGDVKIFQSALEGLQITASEVLSPIARDITQQGTELLNVMNRAGKARGIEGIADAFIGQIPKLLPKATKGLEKLLGGVGKKMPKLVKGLFASLPSMIGSLSDLVPTLATGLFDSISAAAGQIITDLPAIGMKLFSGMFNLGKSVISGAGKVLKTGLQALFGALPRQYESLGTINTDLHYAVNTDADVDNSTARAQVDEAVGAFTEDLKSMGLTVENIASILAFSGTQGELEMELMKNYPNLSTAQRNAIIKQFAANGAKTAITSALTGLGIDQDDIVKILSYKDSGDEAAISDLLQDKYPDVKKAAIDAVNKRWDNSGHSIETDLAGLGLSQGDIYKALLYKSTGDEGALVKLLEKNYPDVKKFALQALENKWNNSTESGVGGASLGFVTDLIVQMFTDGVTEDDEDIKAALETAKGVIDGYKQQLIDVINGGGDEDGSAQNTLDLLDTFDSELTNYMSSYANASSAVCAEQGAVLLQMAKQVQDAADSIMGSRNQVESYEEQLFAFGAGGEKLSDEDLLGALGYIGKMYQGAIEKAQKDKENATLAANEYRDVNAEFVAATEDAARDAEAAVASLLVGQMGRESVEGLDAALAITALRDQIEASIEANGGVALQTEIESIMRDAGYGDDLIGKAISAIFGEQQWGGATDIGAVENTALSDDIKNVVINQLTSGLGQTPTAIASALYSAGYGEDVVQAVMNALFTPVKSVLDSPNLDSIIGTLDFGTYGQIVATAINNGLITGMGEGEEIDVNQYIAALLVQYGFTAPPVEVAVPVEPEPSLTTEDERSEKFAGQARDAVQKSVDAGSANTAPVKVKTNVEADVGDVQTGPDTGMKKATQEAVDAVIEAQKFSASVDVATSVNVTISDSNALEIGTQLGGDLGAAMATSIAMKSTDIANAAARLSNTAVRYIKTGTSAARISGTNFGQGYADGIGSKLGAVIKSAAALARAAIKAVKVTQEEGSPSKITRASGQFFGAGFALGISDQFKAVAKVASNMASGAAEALSMRSMPSPAYSYGAAGGGGTSIDYDRLAYAMSQRPAPVLMMDGVEVARVNAENEARAQNNRASDIAMRYGSR